MIVDGTWAKQLQYENRSCWEVTQLGTKQKVPLLGVPAS